MIKISVTLFIFFRFFTAAFAGEVFSNEKGTLVSVEEKSSDFFYLKITGLSTKWENRAFKVKRTLVASKERYSFDYEVKLTGGKQLQTFTVLSQIGDEIKTGKRFKRFELYFPEGNVNRPVIVTLRPDLTQEMKDRILDLEFSKTPFTPQTE